MAWLALGMSGEAAAQAVLPVLLDDGPIHGQQLGDIESYRGIPYAAPPVGQLRWQPPRRPKAWRTPVVADSYRSQCAQNADLGVFGKPGGSEDCLYLNVFVPEHASGEHLPVFVWIYGGSLLVGAADDYDPMQMAREGKAVVVTFNYRVGLFGFFAHPELAKGKDPTGNYGLMDQQFALDWVQRNIARFNGDPTRVTIAGESSGGNSVLAHMVAPGSAGKFRTGIAMSGAAAALNYPRFGSLIPLSDALAKGVDFAKAANCEGKGIACLRALSTAQVLEKFRPFASVRPIIDGKTLPISFNDAFRSGRFNKATLIQGSTRDEANFFVGLGEQGGAVPMDREAWVKTMTGYFGEEIAQSVMREYPIDRFENPSEAYTAAVTDYFFACPALATNRMIGNQAPVFAYEFADRTAPSYLKPTSFPQAAYHTSELQYLFPGFHGGAGLPVSLNARQNALSSAMIKVWAQGEANWPRFDAAKDNVMTFDLAGPRLQEGKFRKAHHCDFWDAAGVY